MKKILYISYDGMTDPLGQSQVLPYLQGLSALGYDFTLLSFEKKKQFSQFGKTIQVICDAAGIDWVPLVFHTSPPVLAKIFDRYTLFSTAQKLHRQKKFDMVHCRSYIAAELGLKFKKRYGIKFLFDMRGFWADEKKDSGAWDQNNFFFRSVYRYYKKKESDFLKYADHIISLTEAGKIEMMKWASYNTNIPITVIPCCTDMQLFSMTSLEEKEKTRNLLGLSQKNLIISYLGSLGAWYMLNEMLAFFKILKKSYSDAIFLFITHSDPEEIVKKLEKFALSRNDVMIIKASRKEVPVFTKASDINISFIQPVYSKISSSPTKLGEVLALGIPVISNSGVGDVAEIIKNTNSGLIIEKFNESEYRKVIEKIPNLLTKSAFDIRKKCEPIFNLEYGIARYESSYKKTLGN